MKKKLVRNTKKKILGGVLSGLADYFNLDVTMVRLVYAVALIFTVFAPFGLLYVFAWVIIPPDTAPDYEIVE